MATNVSTQLTVPQGGAVTKKSDLESWIKSDQFKSALAASLPKHLTPDRFVRIALTAFLRTPKLMECTQASVFRCLLDCSSLGLEPDGRRAHLIPFKKNFKEGAQWRSEMQCQLIIDYKGLAELAYRSGTVSNIHADKVCENDEFEHDRGSVAKHRIDFRKPRGNAYAFYCRVQFRDGTEKCEVMAKGDVDAIRKRSKSPDEGPWVTDFDEMAKKTVFRRLSKWIQLSPEERDAIEKDDDRIETREVGSIDMEGFSRLSASDLTPSTEENRGHDGANGKDSGGVEIKPLDEGLY